MSKAEMIFYNGTIYTAEDDAEFAEAVAISGKYIIRVGSKEDVFLLADQETEKVDLKGGMLMPGFIDSHAHPSLAGAEALYKVDLNDCADAAEYTARIKQFMEEHENLDFIMGAGWINPHFGDKGPSSEVLDQIAADIPMAFDSSDHHSIWANTKAIRLAGINADTKSPEGGIIEREEATGLPAGTFREAAQDLIRPVCPDFTVEQYKKGLLSYQKKMASYGITMAHDAMLRGNGPQHQALIELDQEDQLLFKMNASFETNAAAERQDWRLFKEYAKKSHGNMFSAERVKFFIDGVVEGRTAYLKEEYANKPGYYGQCIWDIEVMEKLILKLDQAGMELHFHVIGDRAVDVMLTTLEKARAVNGERERRPIAAHVQVLDRADYERLRRENVAISANPFWFVKAPGYFEIETECLGEERAEHEYPMKSLFDQGLMVASASDYSATPLPRPLEGIQLAITRSLPEFDGKEELTLGKEERISMKQALQSFTINGAKLAKNENVTGSIKDGKLADLVVLDKNLFEAEPFEVSKVRELMTISEGKVIYTSSLASR